MQNKDKIILDLCGGTGSWSKPYKDAGYDVRVITWPQYDVKTYIPPDNVYGIFAAPPCTMFSMARTNAKTPRDMKSALEVVNACLSIIAQCQYGGKRLQFWALENPKARLRWFLGKPPLSMNPYDYGDRVRKPTDIWGNYNIPKQNPVELSEEEKVKFGSNQALLPPLPEGYNKYQCSNQRAARRAITPPMWAKAFYEANK